MAWRWAAASQIGTSHIKLGTRKQDAFRCFTVGKDGEEVLCIIVCDGAGSAQYGGEGASVVCRHLASSLRSLDALPTDQEIWDSIDLIRDSLTQAAENRGVTRRAFASTLLLVFSTKEGTLLCHVGDGAVVGRGANGAWQALSWPENGEYASTTYFLTDDPSPRLRLSRTSEPFDAFAVFSDGIEDLALDQKTETAHEPFFRSMIAPLDRLSEAGKSPALSHALAAFLDSDRVCERTDDDKTLVLASRQ